MPMHMRREISRHTRKIRAEKIPVLMRKASVGFVFITVDGVYLGLAHRISSTISGRMIPVATIRLGVAVQSLKKQIIMPKMTKAKRAIVPDPSP